MKKIIVTSVIALTVALVGAATASAAFNTNLSVGSTGADVSALQTWLISKGFNIPSIASGAATPGYFGQQTKAAVIAYQASVGLPNTGFVGPLTRAILNGSGPVVTGPVVCPVGYSCTPTPGTTPTTPVLGSTDGSVSVSASSFVSTGASLKKGDTKDVVAVRLQATAGPVSVSRLDVHFSVRPWLFFSQVTLKDSMGKVIATKAISSAADATEVTVGSDYLVRFEGLNYVVTPGTNPDLAVGVTVLAATDKIPTNGQTVIANIPSGAIRTINGLGITDSVGGVALASPLSSSGTGATSFTLTSTGSVAIISTRVGTASPAVDQSQVVSATVATNNVPLGYYGLKAQNNNATLNSFNVSVQTNPNYGNVSQLISNVRLVDGSTSYGSTQVGSTNVFTFSNLNIALTQDSWKEFKVVADIAATSSDVAASTTLVSSTLNLVDANYNSVTSLGSDQTSINTLLTVNSVSVTSTSVVKEAGITDAANGPVQRYPVKYTYTLTNNSSNSLYVPTDVSAAIGTTTSPTNASSTITAYEPVTAVPGDTATGYILPANGSRTFTVSGVIKKSSNASASERLSINRITFGTTSAGTGSTITSNLSTVLTVKGDF